MIQNFVIGFVCGAVVAAIVAAICVAAEVVAGTIMLGYGPAAYLVAIFLAGLLGGVLNMGGGNRV